jgi:FkbM family methyltransferase
MKGINEDFMNRLLYFVARLLRRLANRIAPNENVGYLERFHMVLLKAGYSPDLIVDVGANRGQWSTKTIKYFPNATYHLYEPQEELLPDLQKLQRISSKVSINIMGVGAVKGEMAFSINPRDDSSTFRLTQEEAEARGFKQRRLPVITLDEEYFDKGIAPSIVKIDAEGWDIDVIRGGVETIKTAEVVFVESAILNKSVNNTLPTIVNMMDDMGFKLVDFTDLNRTPGMKALWLVEAAFVKKGENLDAIVTNYN